LLPWAAGYVGYKIGWSHGHQAGHLEKIKAVDWAERVAAGRVEPDLWGNPPGFISVADLTYSGGIDLADEDQ